MKQEKRGKNIFYVLVCLALIMSIMSFIKSESSFAQGGVKDSQAAQAAELNARAIDGVGKEVYFASKAEVEQVEKSITTMADFIYSRSGLIIASNVRAELAKQELNTLKGEQPLINHSQLGTQLRDEALNKLSVLSDGDINEVTESLRGFNSSEIEQSKRTGNIRPRATWIIKMTPEEAKVALGALRDKNTQTLFSGTIDNAIRNGMSRKKQLLSNALPNTFSGEGLTPIKAFLLSYAAAADDPLTDSKTNLKTRMDNFQKLAIKIGSNYPSSTGQFAYGDNGYLYASPLSVFFSNDQQLKLLSSWEKK